MHQQNISLAHAIQNILQDNSTTLQRVKFNKVRTILSDFGQIGCLEMFGKSCFYSYSKTPKKRGCFRTFDSLTSIFGSVLLHC